MTRFNASTITNNKRLLFKSRVKGRVKWLVLLGAGLLACSSHGADKLRTYCQHPELNLGAYDNTVGNLSNGGVV